MRKPKKVTPSLEDLNMIEKGKKYASQMCVAGLPEEFEKQQRTGEQSYQDRGIGRHVRAELKLSEDAADAGDPAVQEQKHRSR